MFECPRCHCDQLYRVSRTALERLLVVQSFQCRMCDYRGRVPRRGLTAILGLLPGFREQRPGVRPEAADESELRLR